MIRRFRTLPAHVRTAQRVVLLLLLVIAAFLVWSVNFKVEQIARSTGQVISSSRTQLIQATNDGVIEKFSVKEGDRVKKGDLLLSLEREQGEAALIDSRGKVAALRATLVRLHAEVLGRPLVFPPEVQKFPAFVANQTELFQRRQRALNEETRALKSMLDSTREELGVSEPLLASGDISRVEILRLQKAVAELEGQITNRRNKYFQDAQAEMTKAEEELATQLQVLADRATTFERTEVRAPTDAVVRNMRITTVGARVRAGDIVMELTPTGTELVVEGKFKPSDIAYIHVGLPASVKLDAYDYAIYGALSGKVRYVSPDALNEETRAGENVFYRVQVAIDPVQSHHVVGHRAIEVQPGMTSQIDIRGDKQSIFRYLTKPITKTFSEAFGER